MKRILLAICLAINTSANAETFRLGWAAWSDAEVMSRLAKLVIEENTDHQVDRILADIGIQYSGIASGDLDFMMMSWQPETHRDYLEKFGDDLDDLGCLYAGARLGWAVPAYVPASTLGTITDLSKPAVQRSLGWRIQGVDPGAGITRLSEEALEAYRLEHYQLQYASGAGMAVALKRAIDRNQWIVITAWRPHWIFGKHELRFLEDPKGILSSDETVHVIARKGLREEHPDVAAILAQMQLPIEELEAIMLAGENSSYDQAVRDYVRQHPERVSRWVKDER